MFTEETHFIPAMAYGPVSLHRLL